jgi:hypothetical protein
MNPLNETTYLLLSIAALGGVTAFNLWTSRINQFFFFARTVTPEFRASEAAAGIVRRYVMRIVAGLIVSILLLLGIALVERLSVLASFEIVLLLLAICANTSFARAHRETGEASASSREKTEAEASESAAPDRPVIAVPLLQAAHPSFLFAVLLPLLAAGAMWLLSMGISRVGFAAFSAAVSSNGGDFLTGLGLGLLAGDILMYLQLRFFSRNRSPLARFTGISCTLLGWMGAAAIGVAAFSVPLCLVITHEQRCIILCVVFGVAFLRVFYGWTRKNIFTPQQVEQHGDQFWRWGLFYYNSSDPVLLIQNRSCPGYTFNFANFLSWLIVLALLGDFGFLFFLQLHR